MKKTLAIVALVLCTMLFCTMAMADGNGFGFKLLAGGAFGSGRDTDDVTEAHSKNDDEDRAYVTITSRSIIDKDEAKIFVVQSGESSARTEKLYVDATSPSTNSKKTLDYTASYSAGTSYKLRCEAITLWHDISISGRWNP